MSKISLIFIYKSNRKTIESDIESYFKEPAKEYALSIRKRLSDLYFVCEL